MKVFERSGPVNTNETISVLQDAKQPLEFLVVASVTGESAVKSAERTLICLKRYLNLKQGEMNG